jgi:hypothetical protein
MRIWPTKRRWKQMVIAAVTIVAIALIANGFMIWRTDARLQARIDAIRAAGEPATIADLAPEPIPAGQNAAAYIDKLVPRLDEFDKDLAHFYDRTPVGKAYDAARRRDEAPTAEQLAAIRAIVDNYRDIEVGITAAAACDRYASLTDFSVNHHQLIEDSLERVQKIRTGARYAAWRMEVLTRDGQADAAVRLGTQVMRLARLHNAEPLLINFLVGIAVRMTVAQPLYDALATGAVTPETLAGLDEELARHDDLHQLVQVLKTEQAFCISVASESGVVQQIEEINPVWLKLAGWPIRSMYVSSLEVFDNNFELAELPFYETRDRFNADGSLKSTGRGVLGRLLEPGLFAAYTAHTRNLARMRCLRIASSLARYRDEHGREASGLEGLSLPQEATIDPFTGESLKLKHTPNGWLIYSVMQNGVDDGGEFNEAQKKDDQGFAPRKHRTED